MRARSEHTWQSSTGTPAAGGPADATVERPAPSRLETTLPVLSPRAEPPARLAWPIEVDAFGLTHTGLVRPCNEDQFLIAELDRQMLIRETSVESSAETRWRSQRQAVLLAVADGMGGHAGGAMASQVVLDALAGHLLHTLPWSGPLDAAALHAADDEARRALAACEERLTAVADRKGMLGGQPGTTLTAAYIAWPQLLLLHVGDSRLYLLRDGELTQLTTDHTVFTDPQDSHKRLETSPMRHVLTNAIMSGPDHAVGEVRRLALDVGDRLLVASDGLTEHVADAQLREVMRRHESPEDACKELVTLACDGGGSDNITVIIARFLPLVLS